MLTQLKQLFSEVVLGLFKGVVQMSADHGISHWYAAMESSLSRLLARFGIHFAAMGSEVTYHGCRRPFVGIVDEILAGIYRQRPDVWEMITDSGDIWPLRQERIYSIA